MGSLQSREDSNSSDHPPKVLRIERTEVPEEYRTVGVSHDVVDQVLNSKLSENEVVSTLKKQLAEEKEENKKLREQINQFPELLENLTIAEIEARKNAFDETLGRIEKHYFSYHPENDCKAYEIVSCHYPRYFFLNFFHYKCASDFREKVLKQVSCVTLNEE
ncbi:unnamed protein product [Thelazia callipaeda]|uniref:Uncharacterized protein n=1 Tax=Thelazia callipaeda TaxID=103827 RepID=A0A0N5CJI9_THECL|nr:unnamed protein product [Thelazia callipaeda]